MKKLVFFFLMMGFMSSFSQNNSIGVLNLTDSATGGYTLFSPERNSSVFLINNCGHLINEWTFTERPALTSYLLDNGNLLRAGRTLIEIRDWSNNVVWNISKTGLGLRQHHDIEPMPNGNILLLLKDGYPDTTLINNGRDSNKVAATFYFDRIVEIQPIGNDSAIIVWDWTFFDHVIQDFDSTKPNYGNVSAHPELLDLNHDNGQVGDFTHCNSIDYNEELDQILLSVRHFNEVMIIDHSTTTLQAKGHSGGNSNMGGDILWRWGNPLAYKQGTKLNQKLFLQHDAQWIDSGFVNSGKISVFNNSRDTLTNWSSVHILTPVFDTTSNKYSKTSNVFNPLNFDYSWSDSILGEVFYEKNKSGVHVTENGNMLICETKKGQITEISSSGNNLWTYKNPTGLITYNQYDTILNNSIFRATKYPIWHPAFVGKSLTPGTTIEDINVLSDSCYLYLGILESEKVIKNMILNPVINGELKFLEKVEDANIFIYDITGKPINSYYHYSGKALDVTLIPGLYVVTIFSDKVSSSHKIVVQ